MSQPVTARALIERLREVYETEAGERLSDEKLAGRLPITLSTFNRWKKGDTRAFRNTVAMLEKAGWLREDLMEAALAVAEAALGEEAAKEAPRRSQGAGEGRARDERETG